jgi:hypothetical protein
MTAPGLDAPEFPDYGDGFLPDDAVPATLEPLLRQIAEEIFPMLTDKLAFMDNLVAEHQPEDGQPISPKPHQRYVGAVETAFRGVPVQAGVQPYLLYVLRKADDMLAESSVQDQARVREALAERGLVEALPGDRGYTVDRRNHIEVWQRA